VDEWIKASDTTRIWYASPKFITRKSLKIIETTRPDFVYFNSMYRWRYTLSLHFALLRDNYGGTIILAPRGMLHKGALKENILRNMSF
jgi:hypothetical protein